MLKRAVIIVGLGFGDEGKGLATDFYCQHADNPLVIRFNGGHQAGHTVVKTDRTRHVFSSFGAGTLSGTPTYWSSYCTVSVAALLREYEELSSITSPKLLLDPHCPVTTHYDVLYNRAVEANRGNERHGSCGLGFGATIQRHADLQVKLTVQDLLNPLALQDKLQAIRQYYQRRINSETSFSFEQFSHDNEDDHFRQDVANFMALKEAGVVEVATAESVLNVNSPWSTFVFEGAQGILLDMDSCHFPHVTRSNTTSKNALQLLSKYLPNIVSATTVLYVTRCYQTRHGAGPLSGAEFDLVLSHQEHETNCYNEHQGTFRISYLDIEALNYALACDAHFSEDLPKQLLITCLDQLDSRQVPYQHNGTIGTMHYKALPSLLNTSFSKHLFSFDSCADNLELQ